jgi:hypothetical protein
VGGVVLGPHDADPLRVVALVPPGPEAFQHPGQRGHAAAVGELIEPLQHFVHALAHEALDGLGVGGHPEQVAELELLRAVLEAG